MADRAIQSEYGRYAARGYAGMLSRPAEPHIYEHPARLHVPANGRNPRPGDAVFYNRAEDAFALPTSDAESRRVCGVVSYDPGTVQSRLSTGVPAGSNSDTFVEYKDGALLKIGVMGTFFVLAGGALEYGERVRWDRAAFKWVTRPALATDATTIAGFREDVMEALDELPIICVSRSPVAADALAEVRIGTGRVW